MLRFGSSVASVVSKRTRGVAKGCYAVVAFNAKHKNSSFGITPAADLRRVEIMAGESAFQTARFWL